MVEQTPLDESPRTFDAFWKLYLHEHRNRRTRWLHTLGTLLGLAIVVTAMLTRIWWLLLVGLVVGYGFNWISHLTVEKNRPLSLRYPVHSLLSDFRLTALMLIGRDPVLTHEQASARREHT